jgi:hypothetical protein
MVLQLIVGVEGGLNILDCTGEAQNLILHQGLETMVISSPEG